MNLIFIILADDGGGGPQSTKDIIKSLKYNNVDSDYYVFRKNEGLSGLLKDIFLLYRYIKLFSSGRNSIVFNSAGLFTGLLISFFKIICPKFKLLQIFHNRVIRDDKGALHNLLRQIILEIILFFCNGTVSVSKGVHAEIKRQTLFGSGKMAKSGVTIYNPTREISNESFTNRLYNFQGKVILGVGRLCAQKDFNTLILAFSKVFETNPHCNLVIVGDGEDRDDLVDFSSKLKCSSNIHFWGYDTDVSRHYRNADVFVLSSIHEGFGLVLVEAMNAKVPVISTNCPYGPEEILNNGEYGKIVSVGDVNQMAKAIEQVLSYSPEESDSLRDRAYKRSMDFSPQKIGLLYKQFIESLVSNRY